MLNNLQKNLLSEIEVSVLESDRFTPQPAEPSPAATPAPQINLAEPQTPTHPVWNGELDEPIWW